MTAALLKYESEPQLATLSPDRLKATAGTAHAALEIATDPAEILKIAAALDAMEDLMRAAGLYRVEEIIAVNQDRMLARWKLGQVLAKVERSAGPGRGKKNRLAADSFKDFLKSLGLEETAARRAQRIGALPDAERDAAFEDARDKLKLLHFDDLLVRARPYWYKASREAKHCKIAAAAKQKMILARPGPFPLIYADPPWKFEIYSPKGLERAPDQHYPTLTDQEIIDFRIAGATVSQIAHRAAALLLWCTSSNLKRALMIIHAWDFEYKASAVWDKERVGLGLVFRNQHEVLLYGTRGNMPGPQYQPASVFRYPRREHSAKPQEIRQEIEKMYPDFDEQTRLELFARGTVPGWTCYGFESETSPETAKIIETVATGPTTSARDEEPARAPIPQPPSPPAHAGSPSSGDDDQFNDIPDFLRIGDPKCSWRIPE